MSWLRRSFTDAGLVPLVDFGEPLAAVGTLDLQLGHGFGRAGPRRRRRRVGLSAAVLGSVSQVAQRLQNH